MDKRTEKKAEERHLCKSRFESGNIKKHHTAHPLLPPPALQLLPDGELNTYENFPYIF